LIVLVQSIHIDLFGLQDGLGDTIRVSLTEEPEQEINPCMKLANLGMKITTEQKGVVSPTFIYQHYCLIGLPDQMALYEVYMCYVLE
jgi:4-hydroxy-3-methylbut-2-en-1-yl diphosphate synthase IspG/GcpE